MSVMRSRSTETIFHDLSEAFRRAAVRKEDIARELQIQQQSGEYSTAKLQQLAREAQERRAAVLTAFVNQAGELRKDLENHLGILNRFNKPDPDLVAFLNNPVLVAGLTEADWQCLADRFPTYTNSRLVQIAAKANGYSVDVKLTEDTLKIFDEAVDRLNRNLATDDPMTRPDVDTDTARRVCGEFAAAAQSSRVVTKIPESLEEAIAADNEAAQVDAATDRAIRAGFTGKTPEEIRAEDIQGRIDARQEIADIRESLTEKAIEAANAEVEELRKA